MLSVHATVSTKSFKESPAKEFYKFFEELEQDFLTQNTKKLSLDKRPFMLSNTVQSDGRKLFEIFRQTKK